MKPSCGFIDALGLSEEVCLAKEATKRSLSCAADFLLTANSSFALRAVKPGALEKHMITWHAASNPRKPRKEGLTAMSTLFRFSTIVARAAVSLSLAASAAACASGPASDGSTGNQAYLDQIYRPGEYDAFGAQTQDQIVRDARSYPSSRLAAGVPMVSGKPDILGNGGPQDDLARETYEPGHDITEMLGGP